MRYLVLTTLLFLHHLVAGQLYSTGLVFNDDNYQRANIKANINPNDFGNLPHSVSLKRYCPKPGNQLQLNTSPSWATSWSAKTILEAQRYNWSDRDYITKKTFSPAYNYYHIRKSEDETCDIGVDLYTALNFLKNTGVKKYVDFLEFCPRGIPNEILKKENTEQISDFTKLFDIKHSDRFKLMAVKKSLSENLPVVIGMYCPPSFYRAKNFWQPSENISTDYPGHALCVIGYDDEKYGGAFEIINSWGTKWGNNGFIWIRYKDFLGFTKYAYEVFNIDKSPDGNHNFSGSINLKLNDNKDIEMQKLENGIFRTTNPIATGSYFRVYIKNDNPTFVYVFGIDESSNFFRIFPHQENISPALIYKSSEVTIPSKDNYIKIIGDPGQENLCILYSKKPIDFKELLYNLKKYPGRINENLDALLEDNIITPNNISWAENEIGFKTKSQNKTAILIQIQIDHI